MTPARAWWLARRIVLGLSLLGTGYLLLRFDSRMAPGLVPQSAHRVVLDTWATAWVSRDRVVYRDAAGRVDQGWYTGSGEGVLLLTPTPFVEGREESVPVPLDAVLGRVVMVVSELSLEGDGT